MSTLTERAHGTAVEKRDDSNTLQGQIRSMENQFSMAMPKGAEAAQLVRDALTALRMSPKLAECTPATVLGSLMTCAQLGLRPGVLGHAWLLPFYDSKSRSMKAQLVIGYQGMVELAHRSGRIKSLIARTVYSNDTFEVDYGLADNLIHKPATKGARGEPIAYYAIVKFTSGGHAFLVMTEDEMQAYKKKNAMAKTKDGRIVGPWNEHYEAMAHKTCVRQLSKWMPKSTDLAQAIEIDEGVRVNVDPSASLSETTHHYAQTEDDGETIDGEIVDDTEPAPDEPTATPGAGEDPWAEKS